MLRHLRAVPIFWWFWTAFSLFWVGMALFITVGAYLQNQREYELLAQEGVWIEAEIVDTREQVSYDDDDGSPSTSYYVTYRFFVPDPNLAGDKRRIEVEESVSVSDYQVAERGRPVRLIYAPSDPEIVRTEANFVPPTQTDLLFVLLFPAFGIPFIIIGLVGIFWRR